MLKTLKCKGECEEHKPATLENFRKNPGGRLGFRAVCRRCENKYNRIKAKLHKNKWSSSKRNGELLRKYGISLADYERMLQEQNSACKVCGSGSPNRKTDKHFSVDHCHSTLKVRGLLCSPCNTIVGLIEKTVNVEITLDNIKTYLGVK